METSPQHANIIPQRFLRAERCLLSEDSCQQAHQTRPLLQRKGNLDAGRMSGNISTALFVDVLSSLFIFGLALFSDARFQGDPSETLPEKLVGKIGRLPAQPSAKPISSASSGPRRQQAPWCRLIYERWSLPSIQIPQGTAPPLSAVLPQTGKKIGTKRIFQIGILISDLASSRLIFVSRW